MGFLIDESAGDGRYDLEKFIEQVSAGSINMYDPLGSVFLNRLMKLSAAGTLTIGAEDEYHPDFLSYTVYGSTDYWALLMWYNSLQLPTDLAVGVSIKYFSLSDLEDMYFQLKPLKSSGVPVSSYGGSGL